MSERFDYTTVWHAPDHIARYLFAAQWAANRSVLDLCCGVGYGTRLLANAGATAALGIDIADDAIAEAKAHAALSTLRFEVGNVLEPAASPGQWDLVVCFEGIEHVTAPDQLLRVIDRALSPDGVAVVSTPNADAYRGSSNNPWHISEMTAQAFRSLVCGLGREVEWFGQVWPDKAAHGPAWLRSTSRTVRRWMGRGLKRRVREMVARRNQRVGGEAGPGPGSEPTRSLRDARPWAPVEWSRAASLAYSHPQVIIAVIGPKLSA